MVGCEFLAAVCGTSGRSREACGLLALCWVLILSLKPSLLFLPSAEDQVPLTLPGLAGCAVCSVESPASYLGEPVNGNLSQYSLQLRVLDVPIFPAQRAGLAGSCTTDGLGSGGWGGVTVAHLRSPHGGLGALKLCAPFPSCLWSEAPLLNSHLGDRPPEYLPCLWAEGTGALLGKGKWKQKREVVCHKLSAAEGTRHKGGRYISGLLLCSQNLGGPSLPLRGTCLGSRLVGRSRTASLPSTFLLPELGLLGLTV